MKQTNRTGKTRLLIAAVLVLTIAAALAASAQAPHPQDPWPAKIRILYLPIFGKADTIKHFAPLTQHLEKTLETPIEAISFDSYPEAIKALAANQYDLAYLSPAVYVQAAKLTPLQVLAMELDDQKRRGYYSLLITSAQGPIQNLEDGRGKTIAFTNQDSTSGFLAPLSHFLLDLKEPPAAFAGQVVFAGDHRTVILGVHQGKYDLGATGSVDLERTIIAENLKDEDFRVLWKSDLIPGPPVCVNGKLPENLKAAVSGALLLMNRNPKALKALQIGGFEPATDHDYDSVKKYTALSP